MISTIRDQIARHCQNAIGEDIHIIWDNIRAPAIKADSPFVKINLDIPPQSDFIARAHKGKITLIISAPIGSGMAFCDKIASRLSQELAHSQTGFIVFLGLQDQKSRIADGYYQMGITCPFISFNANQHAG